MKSLARIFFLALIFGLAACQSIPETPRPAQLLSTPTLTPILSIAIASPPPATSVPTQAPTVSATPSPTFTPPRRTPIPFDDPLPTPIVTRIVLDGSSRLASIGRVTQSESTTSATPKSTSVPAVLHLFKDKDLYIHVPPQADPLKPMRVLYVLHGMGARGDAFAQSLLADADRNNWIVVAPTMAYQDYMQTALVMDDDLKISQMLVDTLSVLPTRLNLRIKQHVLLYGFSRGAQLAHRFALLHPERVETVAMLSAGSYTLPMEHAKDDATKLLPFPFGVGDLQKHLGHPLDAVDFRQISFWIAVGERDNQPGDVPRSFDPYVGQTRVDRARAFTNALTSLGVNARLVIFPNTGHEMTSEMRKGALQFLREDELKANSN